MGKNFYLGNGYDNPTPMAGPCAAAACPVDAGCGANACGAAGCGANVCGVD